MIVSRLTYRYCFVFCVLQTHNSKNSEDSLGGGVEPPVLNCAGYAGMCMYLSDITRSYPLVERLFSIASIVLSKRRNELNDNLFEMSLQLICATLTLCLNCAVL